MFGHFMHGLGPLGPAANFEASYRAYPVSFIDKLDAENGDKVFLPPSALDRLCKPLSTTQHPRCACTCISCRAREAAAHLLLRGAPCLGHSFAR